MNVFFALKGSKLVIIISQSVHRNIEKVSLSYIVVLKVIYEGLYSVRSSLHLLQGNE